MEKLSSGLGQIVYIESHIFDLVQRFLLAKKQEVAALKSNDFEAVELFAHRIKGVGKMYGFPAITEIGHLLEAAAQAKNQSSAELQLKAMHEFLSSVKIERKLAA